MYYYLLYYYTLMKSFYCLITISDISSYNILK